MNKLAETENYYIRDRSIFKKINHVINRCSVIKKEALLGQSFLAREYWFDTIGHDEIKKYKYQERIEEQQWSEFRSL